MAKKRSNGYQQVSPLISNSLMTKVLGSEYAHKRPERKLTNFDRRFLKSKNITYADHIVLEVRLQHEKFGLSHEQIIKHLADRGISVLATTVYAWTTYVTRALLEPDHRRETYL